MPKLHYRDKAENGESRIKQIIGNQRQNIEILLKNKA
jgi:hypothetical protein